MPFLAGLILGLAGSGHCVVMCGPLAGAFGRRADLSAARSLGHVLTYHGGRLTMYMLAGAAAGASGQSVAALGFSRLVAVSLGAALIAGTLLGRSNTGVGHRLWSKLGVPMTVSTAAWSRRHPFTGPALMGVVNGLLPCGLLYAALVAAAGLGHVGDALLFIGGFGLGTVPALAVVGSIAAWLPKGGRQPWCFRAAAPIVLVSIGVLLIARGVTGGHGPHQASGADLAPTVSARPAHTHVR